MDGVVLAPVEVINVPDSKYVYDCCDEMRQDMERAGYIGYISAIFGTVDTHFGADDLVRVCFKGGRNRSGCGWAFAGKEISLIEELVVDE